MSELLLNSWPDLGVESITYVYRQAFKYNYLRQPTSQTLQTKIYFHPRELVSYIKRLKYKNTYYTFILMANFTFVPNINNWLTYIFTYTAKWP